ncbi:SusD/RagB family nutrient-binding outer membrane lipoprotein [Larkinella sp.]|uniref:SusD/RagB family nutrient-binding outer membrane lipoprotein n=1 Tax=Larkinella sp. TaxID=2034517 RepID=UPI003BAC7DD1
MKLYRLVIAIAMLLATMGSCSESIMNEIDKNPNQVNDAPLNTRLPQATMGYVKAVAGSSSNRLTSYYIEHHTNVLGMGGIYNTMTSYNSGGWSGAYAALNDMKLLKEKAVAAEAWGYAGIADVLTAYSYANLVDLYGDIPMSEALQAGVIRQPKFDNAQEVYKNLQAILDEAVANLDKGAAAPVRPGSDDLVFAGNMASWKKTAYALKIRLFNRLSNIDPAGSANNVLSHLDKSFANDTEGFVFKQYADNRNYENPYSGAQQSQPEFAMGNGIYNALAWFSSGTNVEDDPRTAIWFSRISGAIKPAPNGLAGGDFGEPRLDGRFYSKPAVLKLLNSPQPLATYAELKFIEAEAQLRLNNRTAAYAAYQTAVQTALKQASLFNPATALSTEKINAYLALPKVSPTAAQLTLRHILLQKYIYLFYDQPLEAYNDVRRELFMTITDPSGLANRVPYPDSEITRNPQVPRNVNLTTLFDSSTKLFWAK